MANLTCNDCIWRICGPCEGLPSPCEDLETYQDCDNLDDMVKQARH